MLGLRAILFAQVPLTHITGAVACFEKSFPDRHLRQWQRDLAFGWNPLGDAYTLRGFPRHHRGTRRRAHGIGRIGTLKVHPTRRQCVNVWRFVKGGTIHADIRPAEIINKKDQHIRARSLGK